MSANRVELELIKLKAAVGRPGRNSPGGRYRSHAVGSRKDWLRAALEFADPRGLVLPPLIAAEEKKKERKEKPVAGIQTAGSALHSRPEAEV